MSEYCGDCKFFRQQANYSGGQCWRYPPVPVVNYPVPGDGLFDNLRPYVQPEETCGEWKARFS